MRLKYQVRSVVQKPDGNTGLPIVTLDQVESGTAQLLGDVTNHDYSLEGLVAFSAGDVLFGKLRPYLAKVYLAREGGVASSEFLVLRPRSTLEPRYLSYTCLSAPFIDWAKATSHGTKMPRTSWESIADFELNLPSLQRQGHIADFLDRETSLIDLLIAKRKKLVAVLDERMDAFRRIHMLRGVDPIGGTVDTLPTGWKFGRLRDAVDLQRGHDLPADDRQEGDVPVVSSGGISGCHDRAMAPGPGVITGRYGTVGTVHWIDRPFWPLNTTLYVTNYKGNDPRWVYHLMSALPFDFDAEKSAVTGINRNVIGKLRVPIPPHRDQDALAHEVDAGLSRANQLRRLLINQLHVLQERRSALISEAVVGRLDIAA